LTPVGHTSTIHIHPTRDLDHKGSSGSVLKSLISAVEGESDVVVDLSEVDFVTPYGYTSLVAIISGLEDLHGRIQVYPPTGNGCLSYLRVCRFLRAVSHFANVDDDPRKWRTSGSTTVLPVTYLEEGGQVGEVREKVNDRMEEIFQSGPKGSPAVIKAVCSTVGEICENIFRHANTEEGWVAAQRYPQGDYVELSVCDTGRGVKDSLLETHPDLAKIPDGQVLARAIRKGISRKPNGGNGFYVLEHATRKHDGQFFLRSGTGAAYRSYQSQKIIHKSGLFDQPGTHMMARLSIG
jgi:hypothetical protein